LAKAAKKGEKEQPVVLVVRDNLKLRIHQFQHKEKKKKMG